MVENLRIVLILLKNTVLVKHILQIGGFYEN